jgi:methionyl-tRNA formyltransferase
LNILLLSPHASLEERLVKLGDTVTRTSLKVTTEYANKFDWIVSYGYRYIITQDILDAVRGQAINLHISLLPWNRGADPNLWSFLDDTPKGITIHYIDSGLDTGDVIFQRKVEFKGEHTLATTYSKLSNFVEISLEHLWPLIKMGIVKGTPQEGGGSYHVSKDKDAYLHLLTDGWNTSTTNLKRS